jgi:hypothetical protein
MKHLKKFENFQTINEEEIIGRTMGYLGISFNKEAIDMATKKMEKSSDGSLGTKNPKVIDFKKKEFKEYKSLYEKGDKEGTELFKKIVKHIQSNSNFFYNIVEEDGKKVFRSTAKYGREGGTAAHGGGGS